MPISRPNVDAETPAPVSSIRLVGVVRRYFECRCEEGHTLRITTPEDEEEARETLMDARCRCGAALFLATERML